MTAYASESDIQDAIAEALLWDGWLVFRLNSGAMQADEGARYVRFVRWSALGWNWCDEGTADLLVMRDGRGVAIECKTRKGRQRQSQKNFQTACEERGVEYVLARDLSDVAHLLSRVEYDYGDRPGIRPIEVTDD